MDRVAPLPLRIEAVELERLERETPNDFTRVTTEITVTGPGTAGEPVSGTGEDATYDADHHDALAETGLPDLTGEYTLESFSAHLERVDLFPGDPPERAAFRNYRRWGLESAALDLALRAAETDLASVFDRSFEPVRFVASMRLGEPPSIDRVKTVLDRMPGLGLKLDPTPEWNRDLVEALVDTDAVRILDLKGQYEGTEVDAPGDPALYELLIDSFPDAVVEDPALTPETAPLFEDSEVRERVSWDAPIHGLADVEALPWEPSWLNVKPSRFGSLASLLEVIEYCAANGIRCYGGGQFELGIGRGQIQALASVFYPEGPNDVAPGVYNDVTLPEALPASPLEPPTDRIGFGW